MTEKSSVSVRFFSLHAMMYHCPHYSVCNESFSEKGNIWKFCNPRMIFSYCRISGLSSCSRCFSLHLFNARISSTTSLISRAFTVFHYANYVALKTKTNKQTKNCCYHSEFLKFCLCNRNWERLIVVYHLILKSVH